MSDSTSRGASAAAVQARQFAQVFSASVLVDLARRGHSRTLSAIVRETLGPSLDGMTYADFFEHCHARLWTHHRCEYVYKNAIARKILLGRHSLSTTRFLTEFRVGECKADVVLINGTSTCYEIKTELDGLSRLARQVQSYTQVFDLTHVVTFSAYAEKIEHALPENIGILVLTDEYSIRMHREAISNRLNVLPASIFDSLRRDEYTAIIREAVGEVPNVPNTRMYEECRRLFCSLPPATAHDGMVRALKRRTLAPQIASLAKASPASIKAAILSAPLRGKDAARLTDTLYQALSV